MKLIPFFLIILSVSMARMSHGQKTAKTLTPLESQLSMVFVDNADKGEYSAGLSITKGTIKVDDTLYATRQQLIILLIVKEIKVNDQWVKTIGVTDNAFVVFKAIGDGSKFDYDFQLSNVNPLKQEIASGLVQKTPNTSYEERVASCTGDSNLKVVLNGNEWPVRMLNEDKLYYTNGLSYVNCKSGYLQLALHGCDGADNRQLLISICGFKGKIGVVSNEAADFILSGSKNGNKEDADFKIANAQRGESSKMNIEITKYERVSETSARISVRFWGVMSSETAGDEKILFSESTLSNIEITVFTEAH